MSYTSDQWIFYTKTDSETLMDAAYRWFDAKGYSSGGINQRWAEYLSSLGYTQNFPECQRLYFIAVTGKESYQEAELAFFLPKQIVSGDTVSASEGKTVDANHRAVTTSDSISVSEDKTVSLP